MNTDPRLIVPLNAVTATTTSEPINIENAKRITWLFTRADHGSGSSAFAVTVSLDGITYVTYNKLIDNVTNAISEGLVRVASSSLASNTSKVYSMDLQHDFYRWMKVTVTETTDGTHTAKALIEGGQKGADPY